MQLPGLQPASVPGPSVDLPRLMEAFQTTNVSISGLLLRIDDEAIERTYQIPPLSGVIVIPGNIAYLNQFFSVMTLVSNAAPGYSNLTVHDVRAEIGLPPGTDTVAGSGDDPLRMARLGQPPTEQSRDPAGDACRTGRQVRNLRRHPLYRPAAERQQRAPRGRAPRGRAHDRNQD